MATGWVMLACAATVSLVYFNEIKSLARVVLGLRAPSSIAEQPAAPAGRSAVGRTVQIRAGAHGHYFASAEVNGRPVDVLVDSGASIVALSYDDARRAGVHVRDSDYTQRVRTANGLARVAPVTLDSVSIGPITVRNVPAAVSEPGSMTTSLTVTVFAREARVSVTAQRQPRYPGWVDAK